MERRNPRAKPKPEVVRKPTKAEVRPPKKRASDGYDGPKYIGGPRNEFGTRVAKRITCSRCGNVDHVPYAPKDSTKALCRACAVEVLKTYEAGTKVRMPTKPAVCNLCGTPFALPITAEDDGDPLCPNCLRGFTTWQGSVDVPFVERTQSIVEERLSGALVRKRKRSES
jgi:hypothetical protein